METAQIDEIREMFRNPDFSCKLSRSNVLRIVEKIEELNLVKERPLNTEANMDVSGEVARLAIKYYHTIVDEENPRDAMERYGYTPRELGLRRRKAHDALMERLTKERFAFNERGDVTEWTRQFVRWLGHEYDA